MPANALDDRCAAPPTLSVVMAVHNGQTFLRAALDSLVAQTFGDFELIVVDDASTDDTAAIIRAVADPRLHLVSLTRNVGLAEALNRGLAVARGELVARMDADDIAFPDRFRAQVERMRSEPGLVLLGSAFSYIDARDRILRVQPVKTEDATIRPRLFNDCNQFCHPSVMMRRSAVVRAGGYRTLAGRFAQDYDLWLRLAEVGAIANLPEVHLGYRVHGEQASVRKLFPQRRAAEIYKQLARQRRECGVEDLAAAERAVARSRQTMKNAVANDCLLWSELFACMGDRARALKMQGLALWAAPFSPAVRGAVKRGVVTGLRAQGGQE